MQARFRGARAELDVHDRELQRTRSWTASGQRAGRSWTHPREHTASSPCRAHARGSSCWRGTAVDPVADAGRQRPSTCRPARTDDHRALGERRLNVGQAALFTVATCRTYGVARCSNRTFARVRVAAGTSRCRLSRPPARGPGQLHRPQVSAETRTAKVRIELPNAGQQLRLGMYTDVQLGVVVAGMTAA